MITMEDGHHDTNFGPLLKCARFPIPMPAVYWLAKCSMPVKIPDSSPGRLVILASEDIGNGRSPRF